MSTSTPVSRGRGKNKQFWTEEEVEALIDALQELACDPLWKVDSGFKNNYMSQLRKMIMRKIPNFSKEATPHIESKIKNLRAKYNPISEMCMQSGCQWDDVEHRIKCEKQWFDEWCMTHPNAVGLRDFTFPYLRKLDMVWGKDRATGLGAEDIADACMDPSWQKDVIVSSSSNGEDELVVSHSQGLNTTNNKSSKKRKKISPTRESLHKKKRSEPFQQRIDSKLDNFSSKFESICDQMTSQYTVVTNALIAEPKSESLSASKMQDVIDELISIGIPQMDVGKALEICCKDPVKVEVIFALPSHLRRSFVLGFVHPSSNP